MSKLKELIEAVQENNGINGGSWKDWTFADGTPDPRKIFDTYGVEKDSDYGLDCELLKVIIETGGIYLRSFIDIIDIKESLSLFGCDDRGVE